MIQYEGIFFEAERTVGLIHSLERNPLPRQYSPLHVTFKYHPSQEEPFDELVGSEVDVLIIGYGYNENNSGFEVLLPEDLEDYYINMDEDNPEIKKVPHITASLSRVGNAAATKDLHFEPLDEPVPIRGKFGYRVKGNPNPVYEPMKNDKVKKIGTKPKKE